MDTATPVELALQAEVRQLRERIAELENERQAAQLQAEEPSHKPLGRDITERKRPEAGADESRARLEAALASMTEAVFIADAQGRFIHTNDAFATYHRFRNREECSKNIADCPDNLKAFLPDGTQAPPEMWAVPRALRGETATNTEYTLQRKDTGETWVGRYSFAPIRGDGGAIVGAVVVARDVTEHKRAEEQVSRSQRTFSELVERAPFGIYIVDSQFCIAHMNVGSQNGAFRNVRPVIGRDFSEAMRILWPEPVAAGIIAVFRHTLETGEPYYSPPFFNPRHDVEAVEGYEWELHRMTLPDGQYGVICYYFDSTKLRQAEQALRESEGCFRAVAENMSEGLMLFDAQGNFTYQNAASLRIHGFGTSEAGHVESENLPAAWKGWDETGRPMSFEEWPISRVLRGERFQDQILRATRVETGQEFFASYNGCPMVDANGRLIFGFITIREITARKRAEDALRESEARFRSVLEGSRDVIYRFNMQTGRFEYISPAAEAVVGFTTEELMALDSGSALAMIHTDDRAAMQAALERLRETGSAEPEYRQLTRSGEYRWLSNVMSLTTDSAGQPLYRNGTIRDITDRKQAEKRLRNSEDQFRTLANAIPQLCWMANADGWIFWYNERWYEYTGATPEQMEGWGWQSVHDPEALPKVLERWKASIATGEPFDMVFPLRGADGIFRPFLTRIMPVKDADGKVVRWFGTNTDITKQKQAEEDSKNSFVILSNFVPQLVWMCMPDGLNIYFNQRWVDYTGLTLEESYGRGWNTPFHPDDQQPAWNAWNKAVQTGGQYSIECRLRAADGSYRRFLIRGEPMRDSSGVVLRWLGTCTDIEDLRQESEERLRLALAAAELGAWDYDPVTGALVWDARCKELFGLPPEVEVNYDMFLAGLHPDDRETANQVVQRSFDPASNGLFDIEYRTVGLRDGGVVRWVHATGRASFNTAGQAIRFIGTVQDITGRKRAEEALRASEASLKRSQEIAHLGSWELDLGSNRLTWSDEVYRIFGLQPQEFDATYQAFLERVHPDDRTAVDAAYSGSVRDGRESYEIEHRVVRKDTGEVRYVREKCQHVRDAQGRIALSLGMVHDVTGRKQVEEALAASENRLRALLESAAQGVVAVDDTGRILLVNARTEELFGYSRDELIGQPLELLVPEGLQSSHSELQRQFFASPRTRHMGAGLDLRGRRKDGGDISVEISLSFVEEGGKQLALALITDVTERKRAEERLRQSQKLESLGLLAGGVAHDFNNLLVGVIGNASLAQEMLPPNHPAAELLRTVLNTGEQAAHLTRQMLAYSGKGKFLVEPLDLSSLIPEMGGLVRPSISKKIAIRFDLSHDLPPIEADRGQVQQVFMNLAINAADAIGSHDGLITVRTGVACVNERYVLLHPESSALPPGEYVCLEVRDTGCGMDEATKAKIFDPFFSTKFVGRGLGLAAVSGIVRGHNGAIVVDSAPGQGSCFTVLFPAAAHAAEAPAALARAGTLQGSGTILVVDDEQIIRDMAKRALERHGYTVLLADSGAAAIDVFRRHPDSIALVVLDLSMPGMSGEETLPELRKIRPEFKVVVSSGYSESEAMPLFKGQKVSGFVQKPYTSSGIAEKVKTCLGQSA